MSIIVNNPALRKAKVDGLKLEKEFVKFCQTKGIGSITYAKWQKNGAEEAGSLDHQDNLLIKDMKVYMMVVMHNRICFNFR